ncbi:hypothetical protein [Blastococcus tunisiensis]|uniref:Uncharacterized protein n=1 Tax=Blastococcus tunisiensis TaxID=1798228 RepID=A0A1I2K0Y9_9ACTN|nr:hypothetical protein [Blastococcus sp. DSM 46838]SFF58761.1 hypothetical protein SAMN05216574_11835 [Blastococcus sp. DSM 46838]
MATSSLLSRISEVASSAGGALLGRAQSLRLPGVGTASAKDSPEVAARRWRAVTVLTDRIGTGPDLPAPLAAFGDRIEVRTTPAPAGKGTELAARFTAPADATDERVGKLREALRQAKQLIETGEVLRIEPQPEGRRPETPQGRVLEGAAARAPKEGVL